MKLVEKLKGWAWLFPRKMVVALVVLAILAVLTLVVKNKSEKPGSAGPEPGRQVDDRFTKLEIPQREAAFFSLKPKTAGKYGILPRETFTLTAKSPVSEEFVREHLKPSVPMKIARVGEREFTLTPVAAVKQDQLVKLVLGTRDAREADHTFDRDYAWAFQTQGKFRVTGSIPGDQKRNVPVNTGLEIVFSQDDYQDPTPYLVITPAIKWRTERHGERWAIVPLSPLTPKTVYTVTLKQGLNLTSRDDRISEDYMFAFQTEEPEQPGQRTANISINETFLQTTPTTPPAVRAYSYNWPEGQTLKTEVYKFNSAEQFIASRKSADDWGGYWYTYYPENRPVDVTGMNRVMAVELAPQVKDNTTFLQLPEPLPAGLYLVRFSYNEGKKLQQLWVQSTDLAAYTSVGRNQTLVWVNSLASGQAVNGARVRVVAGADSAYTSDTGVAVFATPDQLLEEKILSYLEISADGYQPLYLPVRTNNDGGKTADDYWAYLYHERNLYQPTDKVYFWGVVKDRDNGGPPGSVKVRLLSGYGNDAREISAGVVAPGSNGTYFGSLAFADLPEGWYQLVTQSGDLVISSSGLEIKSYTKPEMKIEVGADKRAIFVDEQVKFKARTSFFDNTPVTNIKLNLAESQSGKNQQVTTNAAGEIEYTYTPTYANWDQYPRYEGVSLGPALTSDQTVAGYGNVTIFGSRLTLATDGSQDGATAKIKVRVNQTDLTGLNSGTSSVTRGAPAGGTEVMLNINKTWYEKKEAGTYYDFIEKVTYPRYDYVKHSESLTPVKLVTNREGLTEYSFSMEASRSYLAEIRVTDTANHPSQTSEYFYYYPGDKLGKTEASDKQTVPQLVLNKEENAYSLTETVGATIQQNDQVYKDTEQNRFLFIAARRGQQDFYLQNSPSLEFPFESKHIPNFYLGAVIFTGSRYQPVSAGCQWDWYCYYDYQSYYFAGVAVRYNYQDRQLDLGIKADKTSYQPGETARLSVSVTRSGQPEAGTEVNVAVVDQALAAIGGVKVPSTLTSLYRQVPSFIYYTYYSHRPVFADSPQAEKGGGGGDFREIFKDTPFFGRAITDQNGTAVVEFTLPDNLTTWIVYAQGVSDDLYAGQTENKLVVTKSFFITNQFVREFLEADQPKLAAAGFGTAITNFDKIDFLASWWSEGEKEIAKSTKTVNAFAEAYFPFPKLQAGKYLAGVTGKIGDKQDGVRLPYSVIESRLLLVTATSQILNKGQILDKFDREGILADQPVTLVVADTGKGHFYYQLQGYCHTSSNRLEKQLTAMTAATILAQHYNYLRCPERRGKLAQFQNTNADGGLSQVRWGSSDVKATLWAVYTDPTPFDQANLISYFNRRLNEPGPGSVEKIYAAWGLTLLGQPEYARLQVLAGQAATWEEKINLALAFASLGETETARDMYYDLLADYGYTLRPYIRIQQSQTTGGNSDTTVADTADMLLLGSMVETSYNPGMYQYLRDYRYAATETVLDLGSLAFIRQELAKLPEIKDTKVKITSPSVNATIEFNQIHSKSWVLTPGELDRLKVSGEEGRAEVKLFYTLGAPGLTKLPNDNRLTVGRSYRKVQGSEGDQMQPGDIVQITLDYDLTKEAPLGEYKVIDHLPSGLVKLQNPGAYGLEARGWMGEVRTNVEEIRFYHSEWWRLRGEKQTVYYARVLAAGDYVAEPVILQSQLDLGVVRTTGSEKLSIAPRN